MARPDSIEIDRMAHELNKSHGPRAHKHAAKLAAQAETEGNADEAGFWRRVEAALAPRSAN